MSYPIENALFQWEEGSRRVEGLRGDAVARKEAERTVDAITVELRQRIGASFRAEQLAGLYSEGTDWCLAIAASVAPTGVSDPQSCADAAFWRYLRRAGNFSGGRVHLAD